MSRFCKSLFIWALLNRCVLTIKDIVRDIKTCEKNLPNSFTASQKNILCKDRIERYSLADICAIEARTQLNYNFEQITDICLGAKSITHIACIKQLSQSDRKSVGLKLCNHTVNAYPGFCWNEMIKIAGINRRAHQTELLDFCTNAFDSTSMDCFKHSFSTGQGIQLFFYTLVITNLMT